MPLAPAQTAFRAFLDIVPHEAHVVVFCHFDADGLAAGAVFGRGLAKLGYERVTVVPSQRGESAFSDAARARLRALDPSALIVTDLGVNADGVLPGVPTCYVDHHRPSGTPTDATVITGYHQSPIPCSAWLAYDLLQPLADVADLLWIAAVGVLSDLGDKAPWPLLAAAKKQYTAKWLKEAVVLTNAARRAATFDADTPLRLLLTVDHPQAVSTRDDLGADRLHAYRKEVNAEMREARKQAPVFSDTEPFALVRVHSACQIHPLIAQQWRGRLPKYAVIAANTGYLPGLVAFSTRTRRTDLRLPEIYQAINVGNEHEGTWGHGHDQASGGHLPPGAFARLLAALGFSK